MRCLSASWFWAVFAAFANAPAAHAQACECHGVRSVSDEQRDSSAIFEGRVVELGPVDTGTGKQAVSLDVVRAWKGVSGEHLTVYVNASAAGGYSFLAHTSYLVYASGAEARLEVSSCGRTRVIDEAEPDLAQLGMGVAPFTPRPLQTAAASPADKAVVSPAAGGCGGCNVGHSETSAGWPALSLLLFAAATLTRRRRTR